MKKLTLLLTLVTTSLISPSVLANGPGLNVPDGGATALLLGIGTVGLVSVGRYFRKK